MIEVRSGKVEPSRVLRFHRTLADGWAYARLYEGRHRDLTNLPGHHN